MTLTRRAVATLLTLSHAAMHSEPALASQAALPHLRNRAIAPPTSLTTPDTQKQHTDDGTTLYPDWLLGTWSVQNTVTSFSTPIGPLFVDAAVAETARDDIRREETLRYALRWAERPGGGCAQDRAFNGASEARAFLGADELTASEFATPAEWPHGRLTLDFAVDAAPVRVELGILWCQSATERGGAVTTSELMQQLVVQEGADDAYDLIESITRIEPAGESGRATRGRSGERGLSEARGPTRARARNRILQYYVQRSGGSDTAAAARRRKLAALANDRAVAVFEYEWHMERMEAAETMERDEPAVRGDRERAVAQGVAKLV